MPMNTEIADVGSRLSWQAGWLHIWGDTETRWKAAGHGVTETGWKLPSGVPIELPRKPSIMALTRFTGERFMWVKT